MDGPNRKAMKAGGRKRQGGGDREEHAPAKSLRQTRMDQG